MCSEPKNAHDGRIAYGLDFLKIIPPDLKLFDNLSVSSGQESVLSLPFSECVMGEGFPGKKISDELMKTDFYSYFSFSEEFKAAMETVKSEMKTSPIEVNLEEPEEPETKVRESEKQKELQRKADELLQEMKFVLRENKKLGASKLGADDSQKVVRKPKEKEEKLKIYEDEHYFDTTSGYWRMLSAYDEFKISHPNYDAYENEKPHWLETEPIPMEIIENSRKKCLKWLREHFENY